MKIIDFVVSLSIGSRYRHYHISEKGKVLQFRVQYEIFLNNKWYPVVRYDTVHGFAHRDLLDVNGIALKTPLFTNNYNEALTFAEFDIKSNWEIYKKRFIGEHNE